LFIKHMEVLPSFAALAIFLASYKR
jgi:hypothetical protein